jgi:hypothetical protein
MRRASALRPRSIAIMVEAARLGDSAEGTTSMRPNTLPTAPSRANQASRAKS